MAGNLTGRRSAGQCCRSWAYSYAWPISPTPAAGTRRARYRRLPARDPGVHTCRAGRAAPPAVAALGLLLGRGAGAARRDALAPLHGADAGAAQCCAGAETELDRRAPVGQRQSGYRQRICQRWDDGGADRGARAGAGTPGGRGLRPPSRSRAGRGPPRAPAGGSTSGTVLEGSVRQANDRLRVTVHLVSVSEGFDLWSETYERLPGDVFAVQSEIARSVVAAMRMPGARPRRRSRARPPIWTRTRPTFGRVTPAARPGAPDPTRAAGLFQEAIRLDSSFAPAWAGLAAAHAQQAITKAPGRPTRCRRPVRPPFARWRSTARSPPHTARSAWSGSSTTGTGRAPTRRSGGRSSSTPTGPRCITGTRTCSSPSAGRTRRWCTGAGPRSSLRSTPRRSRTSAGTTCTPGDTPTPGRASIGRWRWTRRSPPPGITWVCSPRCRATTSSPSRTTAARSTARRATSRRSPRWAGSTRSTAAPTTRAASSPGSIRSRPIGTCRPICSPASPRRWATSGARSPGWRRRWPTARGSWSTSSVDPRLDRLRGDRRFARIRRSVGLP